MAIPTCDKNEKTVSFGTFSSDEQALETLHLVDPDGGEEALCRVEGSDQYRAILNKVDVASPAAPSGDPKNDLIFRILDKQNSLLAAEMQLVKDRADLAEVYRTRSGLMSAEGSKQTPTEKLLMGALSAAVSFGVVTELFKDGAVAAYLGYLALRGGDASANLIYGFEKYSEMRRLAMAHNLCGPLQGPDEPSEYGRLWKKIAGPLIVGGGAVFGAIQLSKAFQGGGAPEASESSGAPAGEGKIRLYKNEDLQKMDLSRLREIDSGLTASLGALSDERQKILSEARGIYREIYSLYLGELKTRDLSEIEDEELKAKAEEILAHGGGEPDPSFLEKLGVLEYAGIGVGFGIGTGVLHRFYQGVSPWRDFIDRRMNKITSRAREDAAKRIEELRSRGVLSKCSQESQAEPQAQKTEAKEKETSAEKSDLSFLYWDPATGKAVPDGTMEVGKPFREFTEGEYQAYLENLVPAKMVESVNWKSVPGRLVSFLTEFHYRESPREDRWKWDELLKNAETQLSERYASNAEEAALIRQSVSSFAAAYRARRSSDHTRSATDINLMKWQMQWYVSKLEAGEIPSKESVQTILEMTATGPASNGLVATYFTIQERAHNHMNLSKAEDGVPFETAATMHWAKTDRTISEAAALAEAKARMEREGYRPATDQDWAKRYNSLIWPSARDAHVANFPTSDGYWNGKTVDGKEVYVKDDEWFTIGPANDNAVANDNATADEVEDEAAFVPLAPLMMPTPIPAALPVGQPAFAL